jgi:hypothetical protein
MAMASILISAVSLLLSITVGWLTLFRRGKLCMTQPMLVGFLHEGVEPKVFLRAMLYATGKRGWIIEALYIRTQSGAVDQIFGYWMYGETNDLKIGSGLRVGEDGVSFNHHFLPPKDCSSFEFVAGEYVIKVYATIVNRSAPVLLSEVKLSLTDDLAAMLRDRTKGVLFTWQPQSHGYRGDAHEPVSTGRERSVSGASGGKLSWG